MGNIRILTLKFRNQLRPDEIKWFRGAVIHASDGSVGLLSMLLIKTMSCSITIPKRTTGTHIR